MSAVIRNMLYNQSSSSSIDDTRIVKTLSVKNAFLIELENMRKRFEAPVFKSSDNCLEFIEEKSDFQIDKELLKEDFNSIKNQNKRNLFHETVPKEERRPIEETWFNQMKEEKRNIFFFDWYKDYYLKTLLLMIKNLPKKDHVMVLAKVSNVWKTISGKEIDSTHPPFEPLKLDNEVKASPLKHVPKAAWQESVKGEHLNHAMEQLNYANVTLQTIAQQTDRIEKILIQKEKKRQDFVSEPSSSNKMPRFDAVKPTKVQVRFSDSANSTPLFLYHELDPKIKLGKTPSISDDFVKELMAKMSRGKEPVENEFYREDKSWLRRKKDEDVMVLSGKEQFFLDMLDSIREPEEKRKYLERFIDLSKTPEQSPRPPDKLSPNREFYTMEEVYKKIKNSNKSKQSSLDDLIKDQKDMKKELQDLRMRVQILETVKETHQKETENEEDFLDDFNDLLKGLPVSSEIIGSIEEFCQHKWYCEMLFKIKGEYSFKHKSLIDSGADVNCIREGLVPLKYFEKSSQKIHVANGDVLKINYKLPEVHVCFERDCLKTSFLLVKNLKQGVILGTPFLSMIKPFLVSDHGISTEINGRKVEMNFCTKPDETLLHYLKEIIAFKETFVNELSGEIQNVRTENRLNDPSFQKKIKDLREKFEKNICSDLPSAFWHRKRHIVDLPYIPHFDEEKIPTKARPIQMNQRLLEICKIEIKSLLDKGLIRKSSSPWSCAAFYVENAAEKERGVPRLVINYKPLNKVLQWKRHPIPNKQDLIQRIQGSKIYSKFDLKSGFWQIQILEQDRYKTAFTTPFGHYEWNVMPFGLKNAPSEFQKIMHEIFLPYTSFMIVYIDDVLVFSKDLDQHWKHLNTFFNAIIHNGLVVSQRKMILFQTNIQFLGYKIQFDQITPINRVILFSEKFPDELKDKKQLQRFLGCLNYISDFYKELAKDRKILSDRLKKNPVAWNDDHTEAVRRIKAKVKNLPCLYILDPKAFKIIETDASDIGYGGILKQRGDKNPEQLVRFTSGTWNETQKKYSTIKREILAIVKVISKFQGELLNQQFLLRIDCKAAKYVLLNDVQNLVSKQIFARWQAILSCFDFEIEYIKGENNSLPDFLSREFLQGRESNIEGKLGSDMDKKEKSENSKNGKDQINAIQKEINYGQDQATKYHIEPSLRQTPYSSVEINPNLLSLRQNLQSSEKSRRTSLSDAINMKRGDNSPKPLLTAFTCRTSDQSFFNEASQYLPYELQTKLGSLLQEIFMMHGGNIQQIKRKFTLLEHFSSLQPELQRKISRNVLRDELQENFRRLCICQRYHKAEVEWRNGTPGLLWEYHRDPNRTRSFFNQGLLSRVSINMEPFRSNPFPKFLNYVLRKLGSQKYYLIIYSVPPTVEEMKISAGKHLVLIQNSSVENWYDPIEDFSIPISLEELRRRRYIAFIKTFWKIYPDPYYKIIRSGYITIAYKWPWLPEELLQGKILDEVPEYFRSFTKDIPEEVVRNIRQYWDQLWNWWYPNPGESSQELRSQLLGYIQKDCLTTESKEMCNSSLEGVDSISNQD